MEKDQYKDTLRESMQLQKDAAALARKLENSVFGHQPLQEGEIEKLQLSSTDSMGSRAGIQNLLLRVRVFLKTTETVESEAASLHEKCIRMQENLQGLIQEQDLHAPQEWIQEQDLHASQKRIQQQGQHVQQDLIQEQKCHALQDRLSSLTLTAALLTQTQAQAQTIAASYRELESALALAGKASGTTREVRLQEAAAHARRLFSDAK